MSSGSGGDDCLLECLPFGGTELWSSLVDDELIGGGRVGDEQAGAGLAVNRHRGELESFGGGQRRHMGARRTPEGGDGVIGTTEGGNGPCHVEPFATSCVVTRLHAGDVAMAEARHD